MMRKKTGNTLLALVLCANICGFALAAEAYDEAKIDQLLKDTSSTNDQRGGMSWQQTLSYTMHIVESYYRGQTEKDKAIARQLDSLDNVWSSYTSEVKQLSGYSPTAPLQPYASKALAILTAVAGEMDKYQDVEQRDLELLRYLHNRASEFRLDIFAGKEESLAYYKILNHLMHKFVASQNGSMYSLKETWKSYQPISYQFRNADMAILDDLLALSLKQHPDYAARSSDYFSYLDMLPADAAPSPLINQHVALVLQSMNPKPKEFYDVFTYLHDLAEMKAKSPANVNRAPINQKYQLYAAQIKTFPKWMNKYQTYTFIDYVRTLKQTDPALAKNLAQAIKTRFAKEKLDDHYKKLLDEILK